MEGRNRASRRRSCNPQQPPAGFGASAVANSVDLLVEILRRLPAKPLLRFKCVSKQWYSIISDPQFIINHAQANPNRLLGLLLNDLLQKSPANSFYVPLGNYGYGAPARIPQIEVLHLCNGLLCYSKPHKNAPQFTSYYVCNAASGQSKRIRVLESQSVKKLMAVNLVFNPTKSPVYHVVFVSESSGSEVNHLIKVDIYSSETQCWRPSRKGQFIVPYDVDFGNGVSWNGAIYWYHYKKKSLAYFDLDADSLEKLQMPRLSQGSYPMDFHYFGESAGHLHLVGTSKPRTSLFTVFEMQKDRSGWFIKCNGNLDALATAFPKMVINKGTRRYVFTPVGLVEGEKEEELGIVVTIPGSVVRYNVKDKTSKKLCDLPKGCILNELTAQGSRFKSHHYIETLASI